MEYAIAASIILFFLILNILFQPRKRESLSKTLSEGEYIEQAVLFTAKLPLPKDGGAALSDAAFLRKISYARFLVDTAYKSKIGKCFSQIFKAHKNEIKAMKKIKFAELENMPSIDGEARIVKIARFSLAHSNYIFSADRVEEIIAQQNGFRTLCINEILALRSAYQYAILEKLSFLSKDIIGLLKIERLAKRCAANGDNFQKSPIYLELRHNKLFLEICAERKCADSELSAACFNRITERVEFLIDNCFLSFESANFYDFSCHYGGLKLLSDFEVFDNADKDTKINFLKTLSELSDKENIDEYLYAKRLVNFSKYYKPYNSSFQKGILSKNYNIFGRKAAFIAPKKDMRLLVSALGNGAYMKIFFSPNKKKKKAEKEKAYLGESKRTEAFSPFYKNYSLDLGVSIDNGHLKIKPYFPPEVDEISVKFKFNGIEQNLKIKQSLNDEVKLGGTVLHGVSDIYLGDAIQHNIEVSMPFEKAAKNNCRENAALTDRGGHGEF